MCAWVLRQRPLYWIRPNEMSVCQECAMKAFPSPIHIAHSATRYENGTEKNVNRDINASFPNLSFSNTRRPSLPGRRHDLAHKLITAGLEPILPLSTAMCMCIILFFFIHYNFFFGLRSGFIKNSQVRDDFVFNLLPRTVCVCKGIFVVHGILANALQRDPFSPSCLPVYVRARKLVSFQPHTVCRNDHHL